MVRINLDRAKFPCAQAKALLKRPFVILNLMYCEGGLFKTWNFYSHEWMLASEYLGFL